MIHTHKPNSDLGQLAEYEIWWSRGCEFKPHWGQFFDEIYFVLLNFKSVR